MREHWARTIAMLTGAIVVLLSAGFALVQNPIGAEPVSPSPARLDIEVPEALAARGREVFVEQNCMQCHSVAGEGSPRSPLDRSAAELDAAQLRAYTVGDQSVADELAPRVLSAKQRYQQLPDEDLDALVAYLQSLVAGQ